MNLPPIRLSARDQSLLDAETRLVRARMLIAGSSGLLVLGTDTSGYAKIEYGAFSAYVDKDEHDGFCFLLSRGINASLITVDGLC